MIDLSDFSLQVNVVLFAVGAAIASVANMIQTILLIILLTLVLLGLSGPDVAIGHVHPITPVLLVAAVAGFWLVIRSSSEPMWKPTVTAHTVEDVPDESSAHESLGRLLAGFAFSAIIVTLAGALVAHTTGNIAEVTALSDTVAGAACSQELQLRCRSWSLRLAPSGGAL